MINFKKFIEGMARIFDFSGSLREEYFEIDDTKALESDWKVVGDDLRKVMGEYIIIEEDE